VASRCVDVYPPDRSGPIGPLSQFLRKPRNLFPRAALKGFDALVARSCTAPVPSDRLPCSLQGFRPPDFVNQTEPYASFHPTEGDGVLWPRPRSLHHRPVSVLKRHQDSVRPSCAIGIREKYPGVHRCGQRDHSHQWGGSAAGNPFIKPVALLLAMTTFLSR
jgi:hypothetical protein